MIGLVGHTTTIYHGTPYQGLNFQPTLNLMASGATCVQRLDGSRDSAIHTKYRISLRSSSMQEPRYPLPRVILY